MAKASLANVLKTLLLAILLVLFFNFFFLPVVEQYFGRLTNTAKIIERNEKIEVPTFSICPGWKVSIMEQYKITPLIFVMPPKNDANLPANSTIQRIFDEITYKLNKDFTIGVSGELSEPKPLKVGLNELNESGTVTRYILKF